jgi:hypothetical protein
VFRHGLLGRETGRMRSRPGGEAAQPLAPEQPVNAGPGRRMQSALIGVMMNAQQEGRAARSIGFQRRKLTATRALVTVCENRPGAHPAPAAFR